MRGRRGKANRVSCSCSCASVSRITAYPARDERDHRRPVRATIDRATTEQVQPERCRQLQPFFIILFNLARKHQTSPRLASQHVHAHMREDRRWRCRPYRRRRSSVRRRGIELTPAASSFRACCSRPAASQAPSSLSSAHAITPPRRRARTPSGSWFVEPSPCLTWAARGHPERVRSAITRTSYPAHPQCHAGPHRQPRF